MADESNLPDDISEAHKMIRDLRKEAAGYRTKARHFTEVFDLFGPDEQSYLLDVVRDLGDEDPSKAALELRDLSKRLLRDDFFEGLELPTPTQEEKPSNKLGVEKETDVNALTREELIALLDERDGKTKAERQAEAEEAQRRADAEAIFSEIEEAGFERGSDGFMVALTLGQQLATKGEEVVFKDLAPRIHAAVGSAPAEEKTTEEEGAAVEAESRKIDPATADAGTAGSATSAKVDWIAEAKERGVSPLQAASERLEKRLGA